MEQQVLEYLAQGLGKQDTLVALGLSEEHFNNILATPGFTEKLMVRAKECVAERIEQREVKLLDKVLKEMESHINEYDAHGLAKVYQTISAKRQQAKAAPAGHYNNPTAGRDILLVMPVAMQAEKVITDSRNTVVAIGERNMSALPIEGVRKMFATMREQGIKEVNSEGETYEAASFA